MPQICFYLHFCLFQFALLLFYDHHLLFSYISFSFFSLACGKDSLVSVFTLASLALLSVSVQFLQFPKCKLKLDKRSRHFFLYCPSNFVHYSYKNVDVNHISFAGFEQREESNFF